MDALQHESVHASEIQKWGGTRQLQISKTAGKNELIQLAEDLFFPEGSSSKGRLTDMDRDLTDFKLDGLDENQNIGQLLGLTKVYKLRFYLKTKTKMVKKADVDETCHTDDLPDLTVQHPNTVHPNKIGTLVGPAEEKPQELVFIPDGNEATVKVSQVSTFESIEDLTVQHHDVVHPKIIGTGVDALQHESVHASEIQKWGGGNKATTNIQNCRKE